MKRAVSISIGSIRRDKAVEMELFGERISLERIGTDGDMAKAAQLYRELDGEVAALGVGGADLGLMVDAHWYPLYSVLPMVKDVKKTPVVDGTGLKNTLENRVGKVIEETIVHSISQKRVLLVSGTDRWGLAHAFTSAGFECVFGDFMFGLGLPIAIHSEQGVKRLARILLPVVGRLPFNWIYPVGKEQEKHTPKWLSYFQWASVIAGDCHYIRRYMPENLAGKVIVTNTTTPEDKEAFRKAGVRFMVTTTPVLDGRSFGTNVMEAGIVAALGRTQPIDYANPGTYFQEMAQAVDRLNLTPQVHAL